MPEALTTEEQHYFDTKGADAPPETPAEQPAPEAPAGKPAETDAAPADKDADKGAENEGRFVRYQALREERDRRRELQATLVETDRRNAERNARLEERLNQLTGAIQGEAKTPTWDDDPVAAGKAQEREIGELRQWRQDRERQEQFGQQISQFQTALDARESAYAHANPDYFDAVAFLRTTRDAQLDTLGYSPEQRQDIMTREYTGIAADAMRRNADPAELFDKLARQMGFKGKKVPATPEDKLKAIAAGQAAGKSLSSAPGGAQPGLTLDALADMSDDDFKAVALDPKKWKKMWS